MRFTSRSPLRPSFSPLAVVILVLLFSGQAFAPVGAVSIPSAEVSYRTSIRGVVLDKDTALPIPDALIEIADLSVATFSDHQGQFSMTEVPIPEAMVRATVTIKAQGLGNWTLANVRLFDKDTLILEAQLESDPVTILIPEINYEERYDRGLSIPLSAFSDAGAGGTQQLLPETIRVRVTGQVARCNLNAPYKVEVVDFRQYVKNVLPNEWYASWPTESLRAGGLAAKMYAWQLISIGGRYEDADVFDSVCDQVYVAGVEYASTNNAIDFTWDWRLTRADGRLFRTHYLDWYWRCQNYGWQGFCIGQWDTNYHALGNKGYDKLTWDEMIYRYYWNSTLSYIPELPPFKFQLHFYGNGWGDYDRVKIPLLDANQGSLPVNIGAADFTIEWWMKADIDENLSPLCSSAGNAWMDGNILFDRDLFVDGEHGDYGISLTQGTIAFGVSHGALSSTLCGTMPVADQKWHHIAVTRRSIDGLLRIFVDGKLDQESIGPVGDISYRPGRSSTSPDQEPYLVIGARKSDQGLAFQGWLDEIRISNILRYEAPFQPPKAPFITDGNTMALYHFDEGFGNRIGDSSLAQGGPSDGTRHYGGHPNNGPEWEVSSLSTLTHAAYLPSIMK